ncbi:EF-hand calcium-binding domain-containing protein 1 [Orchesella cincta]|uniref:EF-hand calcium-binding domain-containing protein 1 n=1 Tax=Orchesella cincta TaxID=48709 RepID=A0A1D2NAF7_ORCCI|nr:EF-hand calcium-binding domain-containing protein 1 [Orchesella cincta]
MTQTLAQVHKLTSLADQLSKVTHFNAEECRSLSFIHQRIEAVGRIDRMRMREILHVLFDITDDVMLDLVFHSFDRDSDGYVDEFEWAKGLSCMLRGTTEELIDWCYYVYDLNGDGGLAREELHHCLKGCIYSGYGVEGDEMEECEREIVEIVMKGLDVDKDGQITQQDFEAACLQDPLLLVSIGPCLPKSQCCAAFLALITEKYRSYTGPMGRTKKKKVGFSGHPSRLMSTQVDDRLRRRSQSSGMKSSFIL